MLNPHIARVRWKSGRNICLAIASAFPLKAQFEPGPSLGEPSLVLGNRSRMCSRHSLGLRSRHDSTDYFHVIVPPASMQSSRRYFTSYVPIVVCRSRSLLQARLSTAVPDAVLPPPSLGSYRLLPCNRTFCTPHKGVPRSMQSWMPE